MPPTVRGSATPPTPPNVSVTSCMGRTDVAALDEYCGALPDAADRSAGRRPARAPAAERPGQATEESGSLGQVLLALPTAAPRRTARSPSRARGLDAEDLLRTGRLGTRKKPATTRSRQLPGRDGRRHERQLRVCAAAVDVRARGHRMGPLSPAPRLSERRVVLLVRLRTTCGSRVAPLPRDELHDVYRDHVNAVYGFFAYSVSDQVAEELTATTFERVVRYSGALRSKPVEPAHVDHGDRAKRARRPLPEEPPPVWTVAGRRAACCSSASRPPRMLRSGTQASIL